MLALNNINYKDSTIGILIMLAMNNIKHKASIFHVSKDDHKKNEVPWTAETSQTVKFIFSNIA